MQQILPDGAEGITAFSGVFQPTVNLPFLDCVNIDSISYAVHSTFRQYYNHYHCAVLPIYSASNNEMHNVSEEYCTILRQLRILIKTTMLFW